MNKQLVRIVLSLAMCVCAAPAAAQTGTVSRAIVLPDTLGANFSIADSTKATSGPDDFDFLVGVWQFRFQQRNPNGTFTPPFTGHWFFERLRGTALIEDHWRSDDPAETIAAGTWTYRIFNPQRKLWTMQGVNTYEGNWQPGLMWTDGKTRCVVEHYGTMIMRFRYFSIEPNRFLWRADMSNDGGKTWLLDRWTMEVTRVAG